MLALLGVGGWALTRKHGDGDGSGQPRTNPAQAAAWFSGSWTGTIDGRPAALRWRSNGAGSFTGEFSDGNSGKYVPMTYLSHNASELRMRHPDGNEWYLHQTGDGQAAGWTIWQGNRYPLVLLRQTTEYR